MKKYLNSLFDTDKPIIDQLANYGSDLPDHIFSQALSEYEITTTEGEEKMYASDKYEFERHPTGWTVSKK